ncbi:hypothetical protein NC651_010812 [Populus alba x Populus x berolinensis]|nr:hypothetical protein NC651_010812 [Populus alba x Populus x berolinensis]
MFIFMVHWLGAVKAFEEFKLSIYGGNDDEESAIGNGKANNAAKKKKNQLLKMQLRSLQTTTGQILLIMDMILVFHLCRFRAVKGLKLLGTKSSSSVP